MTLEYQIDRRLKTLIPVLEEYTEWFFRALRRMSYPHEAKGKAPLKEPESLTEWMSNIETEDFNTDVFDKLDNLQSDLKIATARLMADARNANVPPIYEDFDNLLLLFEEFQRHIRRLEKDFLLEDRGVDTLTGLRSEALLLRDLKMEMERLLRSGRAFSVALIRLDASEEIISDYSEEIYKKTIQSVSDIMKKAIRSFDDAYYLENAEFILSLKQTDINGGIRVMERLHRELKLLNNVITVQGKDINISLSSCIAEPVVGESIEQMIENLRYDLGAETSDKGAILEYREMSPLERFVKQSKLPKDQLSNTDTNNA